MILNIFLQFTWIFILKFTYLWKINVNFQLTHLSKSHPQAYIKLLSRVQPCPPKCIIDAIIKFASGEIIYLNMRYFRITDDSQMFEHLLIRLWYFLNIVLLARALLLIGLNIVCSKKSCITIKEKISHVSNKSNAQFWRFFNNTTWKLHVLMAFFFSKFLCLLCFVWLFSSFF